MVLAAVAVAAVVAIAVAGAVAQARVKTGRIAHDVHEQAEDLQQRGKAMLDGQWRVPTMRIRVLIVDEQPRVGSSLKALLTTMRWSTPYPDQPTGVGW